ncbi:MAG: hypothetical protein IJ341_07240 [Bacteroidales bacterium]|nr:hypothetical protein [Bacteroidales bacterium]
MEKEEITTTDNIEKERAGFITFWLWFGIIANIISAPINIYKLFNISNLGYLGMNLIINDVDISPFNNSIHIPQYMLIGTTILCTILLIKAYTLLLNWEKKGFFIFTISVLINIIMSFICYSMIQNAYLSIGLSMDYSTAKYVTMIGSCISIVILWAILQIKKNGVSCWSQLD